MKRENVLKTIFYIFVGICDATVLVLCNFYNLSSSYFLASLCLSVMLLVIVELYLRIQHNIDLSRDKLARDIANINNVNKNGFIKLYNRIISSSGNEGEKSGYEKKINISKFNNIVFNSHRSGWMYAIDSLRSLHSEKGTPLLGFIEDRFVFNKKNYPEPINEPWIGFIHTALNYPSYKKHRDLKNMFDSDQWRESEKQCRGLFCLTKYQKDYLKKIINVPVENLIHPTEETDVCFNIDSFINNEHKKIIQVGVTLRKLTSIYVINPKIKKAVLAVDLKYDDFVAEKNLLGLNVDYSSVEKISYLLDGDYDVLLSKNIVFLDLWDAVGMNAIVECIVRATPLLITRLPGAIEYLGEDYPFYFDNLKEAEIKADNLELIKKTHEYLKKLPILEKMKGKYFLDSFVNSDIYKNLPSDAKN